MRVHARSRPRLPQLRPRAELELGDGADRRRRPQRRRQDEPARGDLLRLHRPLAADVQRARARAAGERVTRVELDVGRRADDAEHKLEVGFEPGEAKRLQVDGARGRLAGRRAGAPARQRLPARAARARQGRAGSAPGSPRPARRRAVAGARRDARRLLARARAAQRARSRAIRAGGAGPGALDAWDAELARHGVQLMADRARGGRRRCAAPSPSSAGRLGLPGPAELRYRPRSRATDADGLAAELAERRAADLERGFTAHGPHRDEVAAPARRRGRCARYGSQGQQRAALLALLFAERELLARARRRAPLMLLDDVMSELDADAPRAARRPRCAPAGRRSSRRPTPTTCPAPRDAGTVLVEVSGGTACAGARGGVRRRARRARCDWRSTRRLPAAAPATACWRASRRPGRRSRARPWRPRPSRSPSATGLVTVACRVGGLGAGAGAARRRPPRAPERRAWRARAAGGPVAGLRFVVRDPVTSGNRTSLDGCHFVAICGAFVTLADASGTGGKLLDISE